MDGKTILGIVAGGAVALLAIELLSSQATQPTVAPSTTTTAYPASAVGGLDAALGSTVGSYATDDNQIGGGVQVPGYDAGFTLPLLGFGATA